MPVINGTPGDDILVGSSGADTINGGSGSDLLQGLGGNDQLVGSSGSDTLEGGDGDDTLVHDMVTGPDFLDGGAGIDTAQLNYTNSKRTVAIDLSLPLSSQTLIDGSTLTNVERLNVQGGTGADRLGGGAFSDTLIGGGGADQLSGRGGDDTLNGGAGNDLLIGGAGTDTAIFSGAAAGYTFTDLGDGVLQVSGPDGVDLLVAIERLQFSDQTIQLISDAEFEGWDFAAFAPDGAAALAVAAVLPDLADSVPGKGFTGTGLTRAPDGTWWVGNDGRSDASDSTPRASIVHLSADMTSVLGEITLTNNTSVQGVAYRPASDVVMAADMGAKLVRMYDATGTAIGQIALTYTPSGLAYDPVLDAVVIGRNNSAPDNFVVEWRSFADGSLIKAITLSANPDHLFFDPTEGEEGTLYFSFDHPGRTGFVGKVDVASGTEMGWWRLPGTDAIEGLYIEDGQLWAMNDAFFHSGTPPLNRVLQFDVTEIAHTLDRGGTDVPLSVDLSLADQTLADGTHLVGTQRLIMTAGEGADTFKGGEADDAFQGNGGHDKAYGMAGADRLLGGAGDDTLDGGLGLDWLAGGEGSDIFVLRKGEASGDVIVDFAGAGEPTGDLLRLEGFGNATITRVGSTDQFTITPDAAHGGASAAETIRILGVSVLTTDDLMKVFVGGDAHDRVTGGAQREAFYGNGGNDNFWGGAGNDELSGGDGFDNLDGGAGADTLTGGTTNDRFIFRIGEGDGDVVTDFVGAGVSGGDQLQFIGYGAATLARIGDSDFYRITPDAAHGGADAAEIIQLVDVFNLVYSDCLFVI